jgi:ABC-type branched-subunit amino acid transport system substrate-binding protein
MRRSRLVVLGIVLALATAACGSRTTNAQKLEALGSGRNGGGGSGNENLAGSEGGTGSDSGLAAGANGVNSAGGGAGGGGAAGNTAGPNSAAGKNTAPAGGNGGATDVGVTPTSVTVANVSIPQGPVPGLFKGAENGTDAFFAYQNSQGGVYGRKLNLLQLDDQFDCGINRSLTEANASKVFAFVGSFSLYDNCGADVFNKIPTLPDVHNALSREAGHEANNFSSQPLRTGSATGEFQYFKSKFPDAIASSASLIGDVQSARDSWTGISKVMTDMGYKFTYTRLYEPTETDFTPDIVQMQSKGVKSLILVAADVKSIARIEQAADQQHWHPSFTLLGASAYDNTLLQLAQSQVEGVWLYIPAAMYLGEDRGWNREVDLFQTWLKRTHPNYPVDLFAVYGWESARLFVQALQAAGPQAKRASLLATLKNIHQFDGNGMYPVGDPGGKGPPTCYIIVRVQGGKFTRVDDPPNGFRCDGQYQLVQP